MPSSAARAAGVFYPLVRSVAEASGSDPKDGTEKKTGAFLVQTAFQATGNSSSLWLFGAAQNLLALKLAAQAGYVINNPFVAWLKATCVPALVAMVLTPLLVYKVMPPEVKKTPEAPAEAKRKLEEMGPMSTDEKVLGATILGMLCMWATASAIGIKPVTTAVLGLSVLLFTGTLTWADCSGEKGAWTTMTWFAILVSMSAMLNKTGVVQWLAGAISSRILQAGLSTVPAFGLLLVMYTFSHYAFASQVAHLSALYVPFVVMMVQTGTPPAVAVFALAAASNLFGSLTPYASAQAPVFFAGGYVSQKDWYKLGLIFLIFNMTVWTSVGAVWWKVIGLY
jgi:DASS family divalent anion:Na+ symporter